MKVFTVYFTTPNGKEWCHMIANTAKEAMDNIPGSYNATEDKSLTPEDTSELNLPEWML